MLPDLLVSQLSSAAKDMASVELKVAKTRILFLSV